MTARSPRAVTRGSFLCAAAGATHHRGGRGRRVLHKPCQVRHSWKRSSLRAAGTHRYHPVEIDLNYLHRQVSRYPPGRCGCRWPDRR